MSSPTKERKGLSKALRYFYGVGDFGFTLMSNVESYYFTSFLTDFAKFSPFLSGLIGTLTTAIDACLSWIYGAILNSVKPKKWGRYRSWLIMLPWVVPFLYAFQFIRVGGEVISAIVIILAFVSSHICWNFPYVANVSMISVAGKTPDERSQLASTRGAWANLSKVVFSYVCPLLAVVGVKLLGEVNQYGAVAFILGAVMAALYYAHFKMFEGYETVDPAELEKAKSAQKAKSADRTGGMDLIRALLQNRPLIALLLADIAKFLFNFVIAGAAYYYFKYIAKDVNLTVQYPLYILITNICCVIGSYLAKTFAKKFSARNTAIGMFFIMAVVLVASRLLYTNVTLVMVLMSLALFGYGVCYSLTPALYADTIVFSQWKTGKNATGWISGLQNVPLKLGVLARGIVIPTVLGAVGYNADKVDIANVAPELQSAICLAFMIIPAIALVVAGVFLLFGFNLTKDKVIQYQNEIAARAK